MPLITLFIGFLAGLIAGMIIVAGSWRKALGKLGSYATRVADTPPAPAAAVPTPLKRATPPEAAAPAPPSGS
jgi:hypothetical protein